MINNFEKKEIDQKRNMHKRNRSDKNMHKIKKYGYQGLNRIRHYTIIARQASIFFPVIE